MDEPLESVTFCPAVIGKSVLATTRTHLDKFIQPDFVCAQYSLDRRWTTFQPTATGHTHCKLSGRQDDDLPKKKVFLTFLIESFYILATSMYECNVRMCVYIESKHFLKTNSQLFNSMPTTCLGGARPMFSQFSKSITHM